MPYRFDTGEMMTRTSLAAYALFALLLASMLSNAAPSCVSYGGSVSAGGTCCNGLVPDSNNICNQKDNFCNLTPATWTEPISTPGLSNPNSPGGAVQQLQTGGGTGIGGGALRGGSNASPIYNVGWFADWKTAGLIGVMIAVLLISIAAMAGNLLNLPELKAFVDTELRQCIVSILLIVMIVAMLVFLDSVFRAATFEATGSRGCTDSTVVEPCYVTLAKEYLDNLYTVGTQYAGDEISSSATYQAIATTGFNVVANMASLLFAGINTRPLAGLSVEAERAAALFETMSKLLSSIYAQKYFIDVIAYAVAPMLLLLGILLRTFFFTRKLGGLLLAIALSLFIVYPLTYVLASYTLQVNLYGDRSVATQVNCPAECTVTPPAAFYISQETGHVGEIEYFRSAKDVATAGITKTNWETGGPSGNYPGLVACDDISSAMAGTGSAPIPSCTACPAHCRETPFPSQYSDCNIAACSTCNAGCKVMRVRTDCSSSSVCDLTSCPLECRTKLPVENKCYPDPNSPTVNAVKADLTVSCAGCNGCPNWCKIRKADASGNTELLYKDDPACNIDQCKAPSATGTGTCPDNCVYITNVGDNYDCQTQCQGCPKPCRVKPGDGMSGTDFAKYDVENLIPNYCSSSQYAAACNSCPSVCKASLGSTPTANGCAPYPPPDTTGCTYCPEYCRFQNWNFIQSSALHSATLMSSGVPAICSAASGVKCTNPAECVTGCKVDAASTPPICLGYDSTLPSPQQFCRSCKTECRTPGYTGNPNCPAGLYTTGTGVCSSTYCADSCKTASGTPPSCQQYVGYGTAPGWHDPDLESCYPLLPGAPASSCEGKDHASCTGICTWGLPTHCYGPPSSTCESDLVKYNPTSCSNTAGCLWAARGDQLIPIELRDAPTLAVQQKYQATLNCGQCPENCRTGTDSNCGLTATQNTYDGNTHAIYDCTQAACPLACQVPPVQSNPPALQCNSYASPELPCTGCDALCRRNAGDSNPSTVSTSYCSSGSQTASCSTYSPTTLKGCTTGCRLADAPDRACEGCFSCPADCLYQPAIRTDCADLCTSGIASGALDNPQQSAHKILPGGAQAEKTDIRNVGVFMIPALVLPLFNIVIVVAFIRVFSPVLGGDIEIPGLSRLL